MVVHNLTREAFHSLTFASERKTWKCNNPFDTICFARAIGHANKLRSCFKPFSRNNHGWVKDKKNTRASERQRKKEMDGWKSKKNQVDRMTTDARHTASKKIYSIMDPLKRTKFKILVTDNCGEFEKLCDIQKKTWWNLKITTLAFSFS